MLVCLTASDVMFNYWDHLVTTALFTGRSLKLLFVTGKYSTYSTLAPWEYPFPHPFQLVVLASVDDLWINCFMRVVQNGDLKLFSIPNDYVELLCKVELSLINWGSLVTLSYHSY